MLIIDQLNLKLATYCQKRQWDNFKFQIEKTKHLQFGDFACNILLLLPGYWKKQQMLAVDLLTIQQELLVLLKIPGVDKITYTKPGFLNFFLDPNCLLPLARAVQANPTKYGQQPSKNERFYTELVSANPTGLLHIGHARNGVFGDTLNNLLKTAGYQVYAEYLINDAGNQVKNLAYALLIRYWQFYNKACSLPEDSYHGQELITCAQVLAQQVGDKYLTIEVNDQKFVDPNVEQFFIQFATNYFLEQIKADLASYQIEIDHYYSEQQMHDAGLVQQTIEALKADCYYQDGALWFHAAKYHLADKDEVLIKSDQVTTTYYAQDLAYHAYKLERFDLATTKLINIFGADHHGHVNRLQSYLLAANYPLDSVVFLITQLVRLIKNNQEVKMSKRTGQSLTMQEMLKLVGYNELRWFLVAQSINSHIDINLDLLATQDNTNPIYYVLYAYARIWQILNKFPNYSFQPTSFDCCVSEHEKTLINHLLIYQQMIINAAHTYAPHKVCNYLYELAQGLHNFYNHCVIVNLDDLIHQKQRLDLIYLVQQVLFNGLKILKITPQKQMGTLGE